MRLLARTKLPFPKTVESVNIVGNSLLHLSCVCLSNQTKVSGSLTRNYKNLKCQLMKLNESHFDFEMKSTTRLFCKFLVGVLFTQRRRERVNNISLLCVTSRVFYLFMKRVIVNTLEITLSYVSQRRKDRGHIQLYVRVRNLGCE